ncbi:uncharacterized protein BO88DRAFT_452286 [Aspergillus vadensis CBS 113365]|uniref:Uncharacterized protein n=1 Tax=Aspergillus vadensis (strain CBS 113365 / IMI 142717 / IBT 24658) TaxID=1448311 RepID=A0A319BFF9_ASPVC|nr:hypothetical protein BO88DRAFT_452286 [Aspergillus vadensis CBS 113365]PYH70764.1 hypothetical protein BO88DRAFT_452286 [Aspergillus vadensis CBS 113365]
MVRHVFNPDSKVYLELWEELKRQVCQGTAANCFCKSFYLKDPEKAEINNLMVAYACGGLVEAGSGRPGPAPGWEDEPNLPYIRAIIEETLRWRPVYKFGMMHATSDDDWYDGYFIPKGSVVILI